MPISQIVSNITVSQASTSEKKRFLSDHLSNEQKNTLSIWMTLYFEIHVVGMSGRTENAKAKDLEKFLDFFKMATGGEIVDHWTPALSREFQKHLQRIIINGQNGYAPSTINRIMATTRHFGRWMHKQRPFLAGDPFTNVKDIIIDHPDWSGLSDRDVLRLKSACDQRGLFCVRKDQNPLLEAAVFYALIHTGLREEELCNLDKSQYHSKGFHNVKRKGKRVQKKIPVPQDSREKIDAYLESRTDESDALFVSRYGNRLATLDVRRICTRIAKQASVNSSDNEKIKLHPHKLRHTFLKRVADKHGIHVAQEMSGNVSPRVIFRYTKSDPDELQNISEGLF